MAAPEEPRAGSRAVPMSGCSLHPAQLVSQGSHPALPCAFQTYGAQMGAAWKDVWLEDDR